MRPRPQRCGHLRPDGARPLASAIFGEGYTPFVLALVAIATIVGVGLNILVGLAGQVSIGHIGFYAIGAYAVRRAQPCRAVNFWVALVVGRPARRRHRRAAGVAGDSRVRPLPCHDDDRLRLHRPSITHRMARGHRRPERPDEHAAAGAWRLRWTASAASPSSPRLLAGLSLYFFHRLALSSWGMAMVAVRDSEIAARAIGFRPVIVKTIAFALSAALTGVAGGLFAALFAFVAPDSFPFSQSILFLLAVIVGGAGWTLAPVVGAAVIVVLPELIAASRRIPPAGVRRAAAGGALAGTGRRDRLAGPLAAPHRRGHGAMPVPSHCQNSRQPARQRRPLTVEGLPLLSAACARRPAWH